MDKTTHELLEFPRITTAPRTAPERFHERFDGDGRVASTAWPRITDEASALAFEPRKRGLRVLFINAPIREWSYPNILPIGQAYVGAVAAMDGHTVDVLDLNAQRREPVRLAPDVYVKQGHARVIDTLERGRSARDGPRTRSTRSIRSAISTGRRSGSTARRSRRTSSPCR